MEVDLLAGAAWECAPTAPGAVTGPEDLGDALGWVPASVPGTAAGALRAAGSWSELDPRDLDEEDWWFRCRFDGDGAAGRTAVLRLGGLATVADVWLDDDHVLHSENMWLRHDVLVTVSKGDNELVVRCAALNPLLGTRRPRPRWKTRLVPRQNLRWFRTTLLGRMPGWSPGPAPVGPWRPVELIAEDGPRLVGRHVLVGCDGEDGTVDVVLRVRGSTEPSPHRVELAVGDVSAPLEITLEGADLLLRGSLRVPGVQRWWPCTHGPQPRYPVSVTIDGVVFDLGRIGFRTIEVDVADGGFALLVNGVRVFARGASWMPIDPVSLVPAPGATRDALRLMADAGMNMVRVPGVTTYPDDELLDLCDELGILVWQDCMFANLDPPDDPGFTADVVAELRQVLGGLQGRPSLAVLCGGSEVEQQASMLGLAPERWSSPLFTETIPALVRELVPGTPYVTSTPTGGEPPFRLDEGIGHYYGVGAYLRPLEDARRAGLRFASECLAFATPAEPQTLEERMGSPAPPLVTPDWKQRVPRDVGASWDFEDVRDFYTRHLFGVDPVAIRGIDPERALDLARATVAHVMATTFAEWRRTGSTCAGALVWTLRDLWAGAGWGLLDADGHPKAPWFALRRVLQPVALLLTDEGLNGLHVHLVNDGAEAVTGSLTVELFARGELPVERGERAVTVDPRSGMSIDAQALLDGFRDLTYAYRFGPAAHDVVVATLHNASGDVVSQGVHLPLGRGRPAEDDLGLEATAVTAADGSMELTVTTRRFAESVAIDVPGYVPQDSWFDLAPGAGRTVRLLPRSSGGRGRGSVRALNAQLPVRVSIDG